MCGWATSQKLPDKKLNDFKCIEETSQLNEDFIEIFNEDSDIGHFTKADVQYPEKVLEVCNRLPFLTERIKIEKLVIKFTWLKRIGYFHKKLKISIKSWISFKKSA